MGVVVNIDAGRKGASALDSLSRMLDGDMKAVNAEIVKRMHSPVSLIPELAGHIIAAGGKRLRPMLTLAASRLCGYGGTRQVLLATCIEFIHTATLLHDDVVDESELRRGAESANALWGNQASVLVGDFLFSRSFELMVEDGSLEVLKLLSSASSILAEGEVLQLMTANDTETGEDAYLEVVESKTAILFAAACELGAIVADRPQAEKDALRTYGQKLGVAFQLIDDVLDYSAQQEKLGKTVGDDFAEGKVTLPVILAFRRGNDEERDFWRRTIEDLRQDETDFARARALMEKHGALDDTVERARHYSRVAKDALGLFADSPVKQAMMEVADFCIERAH